MSTSQRPRVVILGGGFGGAYAAKALQKQSRAGELDVTVVDRRNYALFYPLLIEAGVGAIEPRHVVVPIRKFAKYCEFEMAEVLAIDFAAKQVKICPVGDEECKSVPYDHLVLAFGSVTRWVDIPGLRENAFQLKSLRDAIGMRDRAIALLELANQLATAEARRAILTIVTIGSNFTGIEFAGEFQAFMRDAARDYHNVHPDEIRMIVLERGDRILNSVQDATAKYALETLKKRGVEFFYHTSATEIGEAHVVLTSGEHIPCRTTVWAAGVAPNPLLSTLVGLPLNKHGYIECERDLRVVGFEEVWAIGDNATVLSKDGTPFAPTAQNACRQGPLVAKNIVATLANQPLKTYDHKPLGSFAVIGRRAAAAELLGMRFSGFVGWFLYRGTYLAKLPTIAMRLRVSIDWAIELFLKSDPVTLGLHRPDKTRNE